MDCRSLKVYEIGFQFALEIYELTKTFPPEEKYGLTSQIRRSSRSVCSNVAEAYRKRYYPKHFVSKLSDADMENTETIVWIEFSFALKLIPRESRERLLEKSTEIGKLLNFMMKNPQKFLPVKK